MTTKTKPYRPEEWEYGAWQRDERFLCNPPVIVEERLYNAYEAGADAMLEALRKEALLFRQGDQGSGTVNFDEGDRGHLCFIPLEGE